jgi:hypothetical protein
MTVTGCGSADVDNSALQQSPIVTSAPTESVTEEQRDSQTQQTTVERTQNKTLSTSKQDNDQGFVYHAEAVRELDLEIELINGEELEYELDRTAKTAKVESENGGKKVIEGEEATQTIEALLSVLKIDLDQPIAAMVSQILEHLRIPPEMLKEIDFEIELSEGVEIGFKYQVGVGERAGTINKFEMDIKFRSGQEWEYDYDVDDLDFEIEYGDGVRLRGAEARQEIEYVLSSMTIEPERSIGEVKAQCIAVLELDEADIREWDCEIEYSNGETIKVKHDVK